MTLTGLLGYLSWACTATTCTAASTKTANAAPQAANNILPRRLMSFSRGRDLLRLRPRCRMRNRLRGAFQRKNAIADRHLRHAREATRGVCNSEMSCAFPSGEKERNAAARRLRKRSTHPIDIVVAPQPAAIER